MPHLTIEYSAGLKQFDAAACLGVVTEALAASGHFKEADIKGRVYQPSIVQIGITETGRGFVAARLAILSGRSADTKRQLSELVLNRLLAHIKPEAGVEIQVSVEVVDIDRDSYSKVLVEA